MDWTERVWRGLAWGRYTVAIGLWLYLSVMLIRGEFDPEGEFQDFSLHGRCLVTLLFVVLFGFWAAYVWGLLWCCSLLLLMPPRFFLKSDSGKRLLNIAPAWTWRIISTANIVMTVVIFLLDD